MTEEEPIKKRDHNQYLGVTLDFTDNNGNNYPASFWIQDVVIRASTKRAEVNDIGYKSIESFNLGEPPIAPRDGGLIERIYEGVRFDNFVKANQQLIGAMAIAGRAHSLSILDTLDSSGEVASRFADASDIIMPTG